MDLPYEDDLERLFRGFDNGVERLLCKWPPAIDERGPAVEPPQHKGQRFAHMSKNNFEPGIAVENAGK